MYIALGLNKIQRICCYKIYFDIFPKKQLKQSFMQSYLQGTQSVSVLAETSILG